MESFLMSVTSRLACFMLFRAFVFVRAIILWCLFKNLTLSTLFATFFLRTSLQIMLHEIFPFPYQGSHRRRSGQRPTPAGWVGRESSSPSRPRRTASPCAISRSSLPPRGSRTGRWTASWSCPHRSVTWRVKGQLVSMPTG